MSKKDGLYCVYVPLQVEQWCYLIITIFTVSCLLCEKMCAAVSTGIYFKKLGLV